MADISRAPFLRHLRGTPTTHIRYQRAGKIAHDGVALSFWYRPRSAVISEIPVDDRELPLLFHARTSDFQDVTVQATVTFRVADPGLAASRLDFGIDPERGTWRASPLAALGGLITETAQQYAADLLVRVTLAEAMVDGVRAVRERVEGGLTADARLNETGVTVIGVRVVAVRPEPEVEKALRTPTREQVRTEADRATYARRALAVEQERTIAENELQSQIELARREEQLVDQRGANDRRRATEVAAAARIAAEAEAERDRLGASARAEVTRLVGAADGDAETARLAAYRELDRGALLALAVKEFAGNLPEVRALTITPDLVANLLARLTDLPSGAAPAAGGR
ncbi:MAG: SPFH domain-containing protein [Frankia sp.]